MHSSARFAHTRTLTPDSSSRAASWRGVLESFRVAFVVFGSTDQPELSPGARELLDDRSAFDPLGLHLSRLAQDARASLPIGASQGVPWQVREVPSTDGTMILSVQSVQEADGQRSIVVVIRPAASSTSTYQPTDVRLTSREREVASLIALGHGTKSIAASLQISTHTVRHHTERVFSKLGVQTRAAVAAIVASRCGVGGSSHRLGNGGGE